MTQRPRLKIDRDKAIQDNWDDIQNMRRPANMPRISPERAFIAAAREAMPKLIEEVTRLREALERIKELPDNFHLGLVSDEAVKIAREALGGGE